MGSWTLWAVVMRRRLRCLLVAWHWLWFLPLVLAAVLLGIVVTCGWGLREGRSAFMGALGY